jgi:hypothetical protein
VGGKERARNLAPPASVPAVAPSKSNATQRLSAPEAIREQVPGQGKRRSPGESDSRAASPALPFDFGSIAVTPPPAPKADVALRDGRARVAELARTDPRSEDLLAGLGGSPAEAQAASDPLLATPTVAEVARAGQTARVVAAALATQRVRHALKKIPIRERAASERAAEARMGRHWAVLDHLLSQLRDPGKNDLLAGPVDTAVDAARNDVESSFASLRSAALVTARDAVATLFVSAEELGRVLDQARQRFTRSRRERQAPAPDRRTGDATADAAVTATFGAAVTPVADALGEAARAAEKPAETAPPAVERHALSDAGHDPEETRRGDERDPRSEARPERPATWELRVGAAPIEVGIEAIARTLGVERLAELRDVLAEGSTRRHQFVLWVRSETRLTEALRALVDQGLVETRTLAP